MSPDRGHSVDPAENLRPASTLSGWTLPKIGRVRQIIDRIELGCDLEADGGIDATTAPLVIAARADVLVAGSTIFNDSEGITAAMERLRIATQL
jgi:ribulose-phosphate 3-epimerase